MTDFKDRERGEERKFAMDEETAFRVAARRNRLLGRWAAEKMGLTTEETDAYAKAVIQADFEEAGVVADAPGRDGPVARAHRPPPPRGRPWPASRPIPTRTAGLAARARFPRP